MEVRLSEQELVFEREIRDFLDARFTPDIRAAAARQAGVFAEGELALRWHRILYDQGWIAPTWPEEYGGTGWSPMQRYIFDRECGLAGTPSLPAMGLQMCGPAIIAYGTQAQKDFFLPRLLSGEHYWCQGFSEPGAGSDLASLGMRAVRDGDAYVVNGTKIWTTHAHHANWIFLLARTGGGGKPQAGITFLLAPLDTRGIVISPIISMSGEHEVNSVFFDDVRIPASNRLGEENDGWTIAKYLLQFERGGGMASGRLTASLGRLHEIARQEVGDLGRTLWEDPTFRIRIAKLETEILAVDWTERRTVTSQAAGSAVGDKMASILKLAVSEATQELSELLMEALGPVAWADQCNALGVGANADGIGPDYAIVPTASYLNARAATIFGGSSEIQRNILARTVLGL
ncbi:acyl-CoA dehydrogenase family protein [Rhizorhapis sp. SPR117]|uniref:acyl-CoA dehydrogenase family protein n=1 Tax=Rhizorhapis sp. SPR117 TaxID=2912611 RepID=UPI001F3DFBA2|nr:acyl-CoA dehydrogenase family protein [Rhizorhapis sp. SPR117]